MARSFIDPSLVALATEPVAPPWNWNPGATFQTAFNDAQTNQRAQEKAAMDRELNAILFPAKKAQAEFTIKQLAYETELLSDTFKTRTAELDGRRRLLREGRIGGSGSGTSEAVGNPDGGINYFEQSAPVAPDETRL